MLFSIFSSLKCCTNNEDDLNCLVNSSDCSSTHLRFGLFVPFIQSPDLGDLPGRCDLFVVSGFM